MPIKNWKIIGVLTPLFALLVSAAPAYAMYSPKIINFITPIRQHMATARQQNGTGSVRNGVGKLFDDETIDKLNAADDQARATHGVVGSGTFHQYRALSKADIAADEFGSFAENFSLIFNYLPVQTITDGNTTKDAPNTGTNISSCLRNDIFSLQDLRDAVLRETLRSSLQVNRQNVAILWNDYKDLRALISLLKIDYTNKTDFFESSDPNYYLRDFCPEGGFWGDFGLAFADFKRSADVFFTAISGQGLGQNAANGQWGSIGEMARARARVNAENWIRANQINFTLGGPQGGDPTNISELVRKEGFGGIGNMLKTEWQVAKSLFPVTLSFPAGADKTILNVANQYLSQLQEQSLHINQAETAIQFNLQFNSLADTNTRAISDQLSAINTEIRRASEQFGAQSGKALPTLCNQMRAILLNHCPNKGGDLPACQ